MCNQTPPFTLVLHVCVCRYKGVFFRLFYRICVGICFFFVVVFSCSFHLSAPSMKLSVKTARNKAAHGAVEHMPVSSSVPTKNKGESKREREKKPQQRGNRLNPNRQPAWFMVMNVTFSVCLSLFTRVGKELIFSSYSSENELFTAFSPHRKKTTLGSGYE